ncbi:MAG: hypothetical protein ACFB9M_05655 [Myxococcota bacterium]
MTRAVLTVFLAGLAGCNGCPTTETTTAVARIPVSMDVVLDGRITALPELLDRFETLVDAMMTDDQIEALEKEWIAATTINPFDVDAMEKAGLDVHDRFAGGLDLENRRALWVLPASEPAKLLANLRALFERQYGSEEKSNQRVLRYDRAFGPDRVESAALMRSGRLVLVGLGVGASALLQEASGLEVDGSALEVLPASPETDVVRVRIPEPKKSVPALLSLLPDRLRRRLSREKVTALADAMQVAGMDLRWLDHGMRIAAEASFLQSAQDDVDTVLSARGEVPPTMEALSLPDAVMMLQVSGNPTRLFDAFVPPGSPFRERLNTARRQGRMRLDFEKDVLPRLTGHLSFALGAADLSRTDLRTVLDNPLTVMWYVLGLGIDKPLMDRLAQDISSDSRVEVKRRRSGGVEVLAFSSTSRGRPMRIVDVAESERTLVVASDAELMDRVLSRPERAASMPPLWLQLRFDALEQALRTFRPSRLPLLIRPIWGQFLDALALLDALEARVVQDMGIVQMTVDLTVDPPKRDAS